MLSSGSPTIFEGRNIIQIVGLDTQTYELDISADAKAIVLLAPSTVSVDAYQWVHEPAGQEILSTLLPAVLPSGTPLYIQDSGQVWETSIGTTEWTELVVPKSAELKLNAKQVAIRSVFWGSCTSATYFGLAMGHYATGYGAYGKSKQPESFTDYQNETGILEEQRGYYRSDLLHGIGTYSLLVLYRWAY